MCPNIRCDWYFRIFFWEPKQGLSSRRVGRRILTAMQSQSTPPSPAATILCHYVIFHCASRDETTSVSIKIQIWQSPESVLAGPSRRLPRPWATDTTSPPHVHTPPGYDLPHVTRRQITDKEKVILDFPEHSCFLNFVCRRKTIFYSIS